jgi:alpha-ketoglutarate-dependent taurine dioxygenase
LGGGCHWAPAVELDSEPHIRWLRSTVLLSGEDELAKVGSDALDDLHRLEMLIEQCPAVVETPLDAGDLLIVDNGQCLHARTPITCPERSERELRRTKVARIGALR